jgi:hypothetical protein
MSIDPIYAMRGGPHVHDPKDRERPDRVVAYLDVEPGGAPGLNLKHHHLGPAHRPADELMHRFFRKSMQQLVDSPRVLGGQAFYPDEAGVLVACVLVQPPAARAVRMLWVGYNARAGYTAVALALASTASGLLPESMRR